MEKLFSKEREPKQLNANTENPIVYVKETEDYSVLNRKILPNLVMLIGGVGGSIFTYLITKEFPEVLSVCWAGIALLLFFAVIGGIRLIGLTRNYSDAKRLKDEGEIIQASIQTLAADQIHTTSGNAFTFMVHGTKYVIAKDFDQKIYQKLQNHSLSIKARYVPNHPTIARLYIYAPLNEMKFDQNQNFQDQAKLSGVRAVRADHVSSEVPASNIPNIFDRQVLGDEMQTVFGEAARNYNDVLLEIVGGASMFLIGMGYIVYLVAGGHGNAYFLLLFLLFGIPIGVWLMLRDAKNFRDAKHLHDRGEVASGTIKDKKTTTEYMGDSNQERKIYFTRYEFLVSATRYIVTQKISESQYQDLREGSTINVRYLPENPLISRMYL